MIIHSQPRDPDLQNFIEIRVEKFLTPFENFIHRQTTAAILLVITTLIAIFLANSQWQDLVIRVTNIKAGFIFNGFDFILPFKEWIGSGLMALFFFLIGLEIKREILAGKLRDRKQIALIVFAAMGGIILPAFIYSVINFGTVGQQGWAIPIATDTAFALGVLALVARRISAGVSIFLAALAIFDDIGAIIIISLFYAHDINTGAFLSAGVVLLILGIVNVTGVRRGWVYAVLGILLWGLIYASGLHATLAGLLMAAFVPARARLGEAGFAKRVHVLLSIFERRKNTQTDTGILGSPGQHSLVADIEEMVKAASTPLQRWETYFTNPIGIIVLPLFALFNAGVVLSAHQISLALASPVTLGIMAGLIIGKPLGVILTVAAGLKAGIGKLPDGMTFLEVIGIGLLCGLGFTMSLFITVLSFKNQPDLVDAAKIGIILSSVISALIASIWIYLTHQYSEKKSD